MSRHLYWGSGSAPAWRAQIALEEKAVAYESHQIQFSEAGHKKPPVTDINPRGQVPAFSDGELFVNDSGAICQYLETAYPASGVALMPASTADKAKVLQYMWESNNIFTAFRGPVVMFLHKQLDQVDELKEKKAALKKELGIWDGYLKDRTYLVGDSFTLADVMVFPFIAATARFGVDYTKAGFPSLAKYYETLSKRPSIEKTWPPHWKGTPDQTFLNDF